MIPVRLTLLLTGVVFVLLLVFGNPEPVRVNLLFWSGRFALYKVIISAIALGVLIAVIYMGHLKYLRRVRSSRIDDRYR